MWLVAVGDASEHALHWGRVSSALSWNSVHSPQGQGGIPKADSLPDQMSVCVSTLTSLPDICIKCHIIP